MIARRYFRSLRYFRFFSFLLSFSLLIGPLPISAIAQEIGTKNPDVMYIDLRKDYSNIADIISQVSSLDKKNDSILHQLNEHIQNGYSFAEYDAAVEALEYALSIIDKRSPSEDEQKIIADLNELLDQVSNGSLTRRPTETINANLNVLGKSVFAKHMKTKQGIHLLGKLKVGKRARFKKNVTVNGTLSVNDLEVNNCIDDLCVNDLSVVWSHRCNRTRTFSFCKFNRN
jgi:hypothetical protein